MKTHYLKTIQPYFDEVKFGKKKFEFRKNDRDFNVGDEVYLEEYDATSKYYSGFVLRGIITYVLKDYNGIQDGYAVLSIELTQRIEKQPRQL